jgi:chaperonin GroEL (HSP60 family)
MELREKLDRVDDVCRATKDALKYGILSGAGRALKSASKCLKIKNMKYHVGYRMLYHAIRHPHLLIKDATNYTSISRNIVDSKNAIVHALKNAVSVTLQLLDLHSVLILEKDK